MIKFANLLKLGFAVTVTVVPALANSTTFAGYTQIDNTQDFALTSTSLGGGDYSVTIMDVGQVSFSYYIGGTPFGAASQLATLNLTATATFSGNCSSSDPACTTSGSTYTETGYSGTFSVMANTPFVGMTNLLSGVFSLSQLSSVLGSDSASLSNPDHATFTSDFMTFADGMTRNATFTMASLTPIFAVLGNTGLHNGFPGSFTAVGSGFFSFADQLEAPEPSMFVLLASGLLGLGLWQRKRRLLHR